MGKDKKIDDFPFSTTNPTDIVGNTKTVTDTFPWTGHSYFDEVLVEMAEMHKRKNHDYANEGEPLANFFLQAQMTGLSVDMVFLNALAIKMARLKELVGSGKEPSNESIDDSIKDMGVYSGLWSAYRKRHAKVT
jgi:hypothetical protein